MPKITALGELDTTAVSGTDLLVMVDDVGGAPVTKKVDFSSFVTAVVSAIPSTSVGWGKIDLTGSDLAGLDTTAATSLTATQTDVLLGRISGGSGSVEEVPFSDFAQTLMDDTTASEARSTLGLTGVSSNGWTEFNSASNKAPLKEYFNGISFILPPNWQSSTAYSVGDYVKSATVDDFIFECVAAGTSGASEPTWTESGTATTTDNTVTWKARALYVYTMDVDLTSTIQKGTPIKIYNGHITKRGICLGRNATRIAMSLGSTSQTDPIENFWYGDQSKVEVLHFKFLGIYNNFGSVTDLLADNNDEYRWGQPEADLAHYYIIHYGDDSTAQPLINIRLNNGNYSIDNSNAGILADTSIVDHHATAASINAGDIDYQEKIDIRLTPNGGAGDATDLHVYLIFVRE